MPVHAVYGPSPMAMHIVEFYLAQLQWLVPYFHAYTVDIRTVFECLKPIKFVAILLRTSTK
jgi:hypothetical protein